MGRKERSMTELELNKVDMQNLAGNGTVVRTHRRLGSDSNLPHHSIGDSKYSMWLSGFYEKIAPLYPHYVYKHRAALTVWFCPTQVL